MDIIMVACFSVFTFYLCMYLLKHSYISTKFAAVCVVIQVHLVALSLIFLLPRDYVYLTAFYYFGAFIFFNWYEKRNYLTEKVEQEETH